MQLLGVEVKKIIILTWRPAFVDREVDLLFGLESLPALPPAYGEEKCC